MTVYGVFNSYLNCVKSITHWKINTLTQNVMAVFSCAAPVGIVAALYCFRGSLFGRLKKGPPSHKDIPAQYAQLWQAAQKELGNPQALNEIVDIINRPEFQTNPTEYVKNIVEKRGNTEEMRLPSSNGISDWALPFLATYYKLKRI
jgi:hypothetical protein